jgi:hypothetical protein
VVAAGIVDSGAAEDAAGFRGIVPDGVITGAVVETGTEPQATRSMDKVIRAIAVMIELRVFI